MIFLSLDLQMSDWIFIIEELDHRSVAKKTCKKKRVGIDPRKNDPFRMKAWYIRNIYSKQRVLLVFSFGSANNEVI